MCGKDLLKEAGLEKHSRQRWLCKGPEAEAYLGDTAQGPVAEGRRMCVCGGG